MVRGCVEGYRLAYPQAPFALELPAGRTLEVEGAPDLAAQLLDKLVENAVDFSTGGAPVRSRSTDAGGAEARAHASPTRGRCCPTACARACSSRWSPCARRAAPAAPHLGLGLYVARLIAEFHGGSIAASNLPAGDGVALGVRMPLAWK